MRMGTAFQPDHLHPYFLMELPYTAGYIIVVTINNYLLILDGNRPINQGISDRSGEQVIVMSSIL